MENYNKYGSIVGKVLENVDPDNKGRIRVEIKILGDEILTDWIPVMSIYKGAFFIPEVDDLVIVGFMGDSDHCVVLGTIWTSTQLPPETAENAASDCNKDGENNLRFIQSRSGHQVILDDKEGEEKIQLIASGSATRIEFLAKEEKMNFITDKDLYVSAAGKLGIVAEEGDIQFTKGLKIESKTMSLNTTGGDIKSEASGNITLQGGTIKLN
ncbi:MAG: rhs element Vgr protein [bacterium]|nr:rhs element Vgr protein [bacterium]